MKLFEQIYKKSLKEGRMKDYLYDYIEKKLPDAFHDWCDDYFGGCGSQESSKIYSRLEKNDIEFTEMAQMMGYDDEFDWASQKLF